MTVLIIEDEPELAGFLSRSLAEHAFEPLVADCAAAARRLLDKQPELILLDVMLPDIDGFELLIELRGRTNAPVLMLTARGALNDRVRGLDTGADDYLVKPFRLEELLARMRALLRRNRPSKPLMCGDLTIDQQNRKVTVRGREIYLSTTEYQLLDLLASCTGRPVSKAEILDKIWGDAHRETNVVEVYINYLRQKTERAGTGRLIHTVRGKGYLLSTEEPE